MLIVGHIQGCTFSRPPTTRLQGKTEDGYSKVYRRWLSEACNTAHRCRSDLSLIRGGTSSSVVSAASSKLCHTQREESQTQRTGRLAGYRIHVAHDRGTSSSQAWLVRRYSNGHDHAWGSWCFWQRWRRALAIGGIGAIGVYYRNYRTRALRWLYWMIWRREWHCVRCVEPTRVIW